MDNVRSITIDKGGKYVINLKDDELKLRIDTSDNVEMQLTHEGNRSKLVMTGKGINIKVVEEFSIDGLRDIIINVEDSFLKWISFCEGKGEEVYDVMYDLSVKGASEIVMENRIIARDNSSLDFKVLGRVEKNSDSKVELKQNTLLMDNAKVHLFPGYISHGKNFIVHRANLVRLYENEKFYLKSRGLNYEKIKDMLLSSLRGDV